MNARSITVGAGADESGTLVIAGRTTSTAIIGVDSKITPLGTERDPSSISTIPIDGGRKLVDVGEKSACAIAGFLGRNTTSLDIAESLRTWVRTHPTGEAHDSLTELLETAAESWDRENYPLSSLPNGRTEGSPITTLICGDFVQGHPVILRGQTFVKRDGTAGHRFLSAEAGDIMYIDGDLDDRFLVESVDNPAELIKELTRPGSGIPWQEAVKEVKIVNSVSSDIHGSARAMGAFSSWQKVDRASASGGTQMPTSWRPSSAHDLFEAVFKSVERSASNVAPPNNVRIITACGRFATTVEAAWPSCQAHRGASPPKPTSGAKK